MKKILIFLLFALAFNVKAFGKETTYKKELFDKAAEYWIQALKLAPDNYPGARNWLKVTGRFMEN